MSENRFRTFTKQNRPSAVLIAEDHAHVRRLLANIIRTAGVADVYEAINGEQAIEMLKARLDVDMVLTDLYMAPMTGFQVCRYIRRNLHGREDIKVIGVTGHSTPDAIFHARLAGVDRTLVKPFSINAVMDAMIDVMTRYREIVKVGEYIGPPLLEPQDGIEDPSLLVKWNALTAQYAAKMGMAKPESSPIETSTLPPEYVKHVNESLELSDSEIEGAIDNAFGKSEVSPADAAVAAD